MAGLASSTQRDDNAATMRPPFRQLLSWSLLLAPISAQAIRGGDLVLCDAATPPAVLRIDASGNVLPLHSGAPLTSPAGLAVASDRDVLVLDFNTSSLLRIDAQTGAIAPVASGLGGPLRVVEMLDGDFAVTSNTGHSVLRVTPGGTVTTLASGLPLNRPFGVALDIDGDLLVADDLGRAVYRVSPAGGISVIHSGLPFRLPQGVALFPDGDYAVIDGVIDAVFRIDRQTNQISPWVSATTLGVNPEGIATDWAGGFTIAHSGTPGGPGIRVLDALGAATALPTTSTPWGNPEDLALVPVVTGPRALTTGFGAQFAFALDVPGAAGDFYSLILSASVFPGWQLPFGDPRSLFLNVDPFFIATIGQNAPPFLVGWTAFLSPAGTGSATLDLQALPPGFLAGFAFYQQGITLNGLTVRTATNVLRLGFQ